MFDSAARLAYVPVPIGRLQEVYRLLAEPAAGTVGGAGTGAGTGVDVAPGGRRPQLGGTPGGDGSDAPWTASELAQLRTGVTTATKLVTQVIDVLAEEPGRRYSTTDLVERLGVSRHTLRGALAALTRHTKKHYPGHSWPFAWEWGGLLGEDYKEEQYYSLDPATAATWAEARDT